MVSEDRSTTNLAMRIDEVDRSFPVGELRQIGLWDVECQDRASIDMRDAGVR